MIPRLLSWENDERLIHLPKNDYGPNSFHDTPYDIYILPDDSAKERSMLRVIIAGGRDFADYTLLSKTMDKYLSEITDDISIICGKAHGADTLGEQYAKEHGYNIQYFPAEWKRYGKAAGYIRNTEMAKNADALVAFWDGTSPGTEHMIATAEQHHLNIHVVRYRNGG